MLSIIIGGQYGSEGKGKVAYFYAKKLQAKAVIRVGGPNSNHTIYKDNKKHILRQLPVSALENNMISILPSGSYLDPDILLQEVKKYKQTPDNLKIDPFAMIITQGDIIREKSFDLNKRISSTTSGTGEALVQRIKRLDHTLFAKDLPGIKAYITDTKPYMRSLLRHGLEIVLEGTQGYGLSNLHSPHHPYVTARDTTASGFLSEAGLSPFDIRDIILTIRTYPIRVAGNSGPLERETTWEAIGQPPEHTSVTDKIRRVAEFDPKIVRAAIQANRPNIIVLNHVDYLDHKTRSQKISEIECQIQQKINYIGLNPYDIQKI